MAYSEYLADRVRQRLPQNMAIREISMMGGLIFMVDEKMCVGVDRDKKHQDRLMVRVGKLPYEELLNKKGSRVMDFTGTVMRGFLFVDPDGFDNDEDFDFWIERALEFNSML